MGRNSINWNHVDVQQAIDDYICRKIPTQAKLRQLIGEILGSTISEQALSIYLKRTGVSFPRRTNSPHANAKHGLDASASGGGELKSAGALALGDDGGGMSAALAVASLSVPHSLEHFYQPHHLFMSTINGGGSAAGRNSAAAGGGSPANAIAAVSSATAANTPLLAVGESGNATAAANFVPVPTSTDFSNIINMSRNGGAGDALLGMSAAGGNNLHRYILDDPQQLHRAVEIQQNLQMQQQLAANHHWHHQQQQQQQQQQSSQQQQQQQQSQQQQATTLPKLTTGGRLTAGAGPSGVKRPAGGSAAINWKDPIVQNAIHNYFSRRIKLQTELRQVIMERLNRSISVNSLRAYLKKAKKDYDFPASSSSSQQSTLSDASASAATCAASAGVTNLMNVMNHLSTSASKDTALGLGASGHHQAGLAGGGGPGGSSGGADSVTVNVNPSREIYYVCNNLAGFATNSAGGQPTAATAMTYAGGGAGGAHNGAAGGSTQQMLNSIESYNFAGDLIGKQLQLAPPTMVKTMMLNEQMIKVSNSSDSLLHQPPLDHSQHPHHSQLLMSNGVVKRDKDDSKPSVRRRINWNNAEVQNAIHDFYGRKILTQAKLRSIIESILGHCVSEQALSIYLKRKKTRNPSSEELLLMNINCDESIA